ncbi:MAG: imidazole glycerol phosphate synthase subunit HisH [Treponema sp.]|uniref:imidazole glycerol phosphate synthase subunit HisH n=1 Tax=Treponema sp. TaxID=166 RepID=UPI001E093218|nr:imidazole glycerol phosphate synthase subunit HisH [Treponema sp.]MBS7310910.1 imidazole glycerol phosphate synthase subunit HisH [Treponema sp.]
MIGIVDYNAGNITSVERALENLEIKYIRSKNPADFSECDKLIFPGVGDAAYAMKQLEETGLGKFLQEWAKENKPLLGICLGSQIIFDYSEEGDTKCLGLIPGNIVHMEKLMANVPDSKNYKIPHMGYNNVTMVNGGCKLFNTLDNDTDFYFVHSYVIQPHDSNVIRGIADYGIKVPACIQKGNIFAFQFHPEKSGKHGLELLRNFCEATINEKGELSC